MKVSWRKDFNGIPEYVLNIAIGGDHHNVVVDEEVRIIPILMLTGDEDPPPVW